MIINLFKFNTREHIMTKKDIEHYKKLLNSEKEELLKEMMESDEAARDILENDMTHVNDTVDEATSTITQTLLSTMNKNNQQKIMAIEAALRRISENNFGKCITCGEMITKERLETVPWATKCIKCKQKEEKKH